MAKGTISKKKKAPSIHSRAARRATSPGINTDKSLKNVQPPVESVDYRPSILAIHQGAGVSKKARRTRNMSSKARRRHEKGQDRATTIIERTEQRIAKSKGQARTIESRRKTWDEINKQVPASKNEPRREADSQEEEVSNFDEDMDDVQPKKTQDSATTAEEISLEVTEAEQDDGIL